MWLHSAGGWADNSDGAVTPLSVPLWSFMLKEASLASSHDGSQVPRRQTQRVSEHLPS